MSKTIDYYVSLVSPWSYLGHDRLLQLAKQSGALIAIWPVDLSLVFPKTGGLPLPKRSDQRRAYRMQELMRWRAHLEVDLNLEPKHFPVSDKLAATMVINLRQSDNAAALSFAGACLKAVWWEEKDISDRDTLVEIAASQGLDGNALLANSQSALDTLSQDSHEAIERGIFGVPSYRFEDSIFWGQDRLNFLELALKHET